MSGRVIRSAKSQPKPAPKKGPVFPIRKPALVSAADSEKIASLTNENAKVHNVGKVTFLSLWWMQMLSFAALVLTALWVGFMVHRTLALAEVGAMTCSAENSYMWTMPDPGSSVPKLNDSVLNACARAYRPLE